MTKKYTVESFMIVRNILGWPPGNDIPDLTLTNTIVENIIASGFEVHVERGLVGKASDELPKNMDSDMYTSSERGDLEYIQKL